MVKYNNRDTIIICTCKVQYIVPNSVWYQVLAVLPVEDVASWLPFTGSTLTPTPFGFNVIVIPTENK